MDTYKENNDTEDDDSNNGMTGSSFPISENQLLSIRSEAPAVLLKSGPGTGKSFALASRIAYLLTTGASAPQHMVILSFTNRDANVIKSKALDMMYGNNSTEREWFTRTVLDGPGGDEDIRSCPQLSRSHLAKRLWGGTIHSFASNLLQAYRPRQSPKFRVVSSNEAKLRVDKCLRRLLDSSRPPDKLQEARRLYRDALGQTRQSRDVAVLQIGRCIEKESGMIPPSRVPGIKSQDMSAHSRDGSLLLATRLGIHRDIAKLAWIALPLYAEMHELSGSIDPSDLAPLAHDLLLSSPEKLSELRNTLKHIVLDEYQDVSVSQHNLIRLIVCGPPTTDEDQNGGKENDGAVHQSTPTQQWTKQHERPGDTNTNGRLPPVLQSSHHQQRQQRKKQTGSQKGVAYSVPRLFSAGDSNQSIYGWRGAAPMLSVEGFSKDYPQGVVIPLETNFRVPSSTWKALETLVNEGNRDSSYSETYTKSPVAVARNKENAARIVEASANEKDPTTNSIKSRLSPSAADTENLQELLAADSNNNGVSIHVEGYWDGREEAKQIAAMIRRKSKKRLDGLQSAMKKLSKGHHEKGSVKDPTEVAVLVRGNNHVSLIKDALESAGVPFVVCNGDESGGSDSSSRGSSMSARSSLPPLPMKPVTVMTMHRAKGEEFDDVYLPGWTEGVFPHPAAVSTNRVDEERRLAYVAVSRARHEVEITHSFVRRSLYRGPQGQQKHVTEQVKASRFLYEIVPEASSSVKISVAHGKAGSASVVWNRGRGSKGTMAGSNLPPSFKTAYSVPKKFDPVEKLNEEVKKFEEELPTMKLPQPRPVPVADQKPAMPSKLGLIFKAIARLFNQRGLKARTKAAFRKQLADDFGIRRGRAILFDDAEKKVASWDEVSVEKLQRLELDIPIDNSQQAISKCSPLQLGLYLIHLYKTKGL